MRNGILFFLCLLFISPSSSQNVDPCVQAQQDARDAVWRPGWWAGGFLGNYLVPYGAIAAAYLYAPQPASVPYADYQDQAKYRNCFRRAVKRTQLQNQIIGLMGLMITYATLNYARNMIWEMPDQGEAPFTLPKERSFFYYLGGLTLTFELIKSLKPDNGETYTLEKNKLPKKEICKVYGKIKIVIGGEDYRVRKVDPGEWEDLQVKFVSEEMADNPGRWSFVDINEDFKIRFVEIGEDFTFREVNVAEGCLTKGSKEKP